MTSVSIDGESLRQVVAGAQRGDPLAADRLVRAHDGWVRSAIYGVTGRTDLVEDVAQQVWARVWERLDTLRNPRQLRSWLYTIARNTAIDVGMAARRQAARESSLDADAGPMLRYVAAPDAGAPDGELRRGVLRAVRALPSHYREPFVLRHMADWSYAEIAEVLELPIDTVETRLVRARRMLREMLHEQVES